MSKDYNHPNLFGVEGTDHINISARSSTRLGSLFDPSYFKTVNYPILGKFASVMNLWYWLRTDPVQDTLRRAYGDKLRKLLAVGSHDAYVPNFRAIIAQATYDKILAYPDSIQEIKKLPKDIEFVSYYVAKSSVLRVCSNYANVAVPVAQLIVKAIQSETEPDFSTLVPAGEVLDLHYLAPFLKTRFPEQYAQLTATETP